MLPADVRISLQHYITARDTCGLHTSASAPPGCLPGSPLTTGQGQGPAGSPCLLGPCYSPHSSSLDALAAAAETTHPLAAAALAAGAAAAATHGYGSTASRASPAAAGAHGSARGDRMVHGCGGCGSPAFPQQGPAVKGWLPPGSVCLAGGAGLMPPPSTAALLEVAPLDIRLTPPPPSPHAGGWPAVDSLAACRASAWASLHPASAQCGRGHDGKEGEVADPAASPAVGSLSCPSLCEAELARCQPPAWQVECGLRC